MKNVACILALAAVASLSCTNNKLVPVKGPEPKNVDDLLDIEAEYCTRPAEDVTFPVKILMVVDASGSMQFTDQPNLRVNAVRELVHSFDGDPAVEIATMAFGSNVYVEPGIANPGGPFFEPAVDWTDPTFLSLKDVLTDYQGALEAIKTHILLDMVSTTDANGELDVARLARTKYVVIFFSDGSPSPRCCIDADQTVGPLAVDQWGCPPEPWEVGDTANIYCENTVEDQDLPGETPFCNSQDQLDYFRDAQADIVSQNSGGAPVQGIPTYSDELNQSIANLEVNANYNRSYQILDLVQDIMDLGDEFGVGEIRMHTALLFDSQLAEGVREIYELSKCRSSGLLGGMAAVGNGVFVDFENSEEINFLSFNFTSLKADFQVVSSYAYNMNALPPGGDARIIAYRADSDADGLDDDEEQQAGTVIGWPDSDQLVDAVATNVDPSTVRVPVANWGDGYGDAFEVDRKDIGYDPKFQSRPLLSCPVSDPVTRIDRRDIDFDGLNGCEEDVMQTDVLLADTDGDTIPDGLEVRMGLDPTIPELDRDDDFDGTPNDEELKRQRDPREPDSDREEETTRYETIATRVTDDGRQCFKTTARSIHLASTQPRRREDNGDGTARFVGRSGYNDVRFFIAEAPEDNPTGRVSLRMACARVQYIKPSFKDPARGFLKLSEEDFHDLNDGETLNLLSTGQIDPCTYLEVE